MLKLFDFLAFELQKTADQKGYDIDSNILYINACHLASLIEWKEAKGNLRNWHTVFYLLHKTRVAINNI